MTIGHYQDLAGKSFLVTGASSGIGRAVAIALSEQGATVLLTGRDEARLEGCLAELVGEGFCVPADLTVPEEREKLTESLPDLDGVCHAAGVVYPFPVRYLQSAQLSQVFEINYSAPVLLTSLLFSRKKIKNGGSLVFISSIASEFSYIGGAAYSGSKAALESFSRNVAIEHSAMRIRSNCIQAAMVQTPIYEQTRKQVSDKRMAKHEAEYPLGFGNPEDLAEACLFLFSDASRWITGSTLVMDGGLTAQR